MSRQWPPVKLASSPTLGAAGRPARMAGIGGGSESPASASESTVVPCPLLNTAA